MKKKDNQEFYNSKEWKALRKQVLMNQPLCRHCEQAGMFVPATEVDHIQPIKKDYSLIMDYDNLQPLCHSCHSRKTFNENITNENRHVPQALPDRDRMADKLKGLIK